MTSAASRARATWIQRPWRGALLAGLVAGGLGGGLRSDYPGAGPSRVSAQEVAAEGGTVRSVSTLGGGASEVVHQRAAVHPPAPDLSRAGRHRIPREVRWRVPLPILWGERVVPAGDYVLGIAVDEDLEPWFELQPASGGSPVLVALRLGSFGAPAQTVDVVVANLTGASDDRGMLLVRWEALVLLGEFTPVRSRVLSAGSVRLDGFDFPSDLQPLAELPLGTLIMSGDPPRQFDVVIRDLAGGSPQLVLEDTRYRQLLNERLDLQRSMAAARDAATPDAAELRRLEARMRGVEVRLEQLGPESPRRELRGTSAPGSTGSAHFALTLESVEGVPFLNVQAAGRSHRFSLSP